MDEGQVLARVRRLVDDGEYLDELYGRPGEALDGARVLQLGPWTTMYKSSRHLLPWRRRGVEVRTARRVYRRGSQEYVDAKAAGLIDPLPPLTPATAAAVDAAEQAMDAPLPPLLRRLYLEIGNGGFGPGYGIRGVEGGHTFGDHETAVDAARRFADAAPSEGPLLPLSEWGCGIVSLVELGTADGRMWGFDPNCAPFEFSMYCQDLGLAEWLDRWVDGRLFQPTIVEDPPGHYRGATMQELETWAAEFDDHG